MKTFLNNTRRNPRKKFHFGILKPKNRIFSNSQKNLSRRLFVIDSKHRNTIRRRTSGKDFREIINDDMIFHSFDPSAFDSFFKIKIDADI